MHALHITALDEVWFPSVADEQSCQLLVADSREQSWVVDLVSVEMENWEDCTIADRVEEFGAVPTCGKRSSFGFTISDHCECDQIGVIEDSTEGMGYRVSELTTFVDTTWCLWGSVGADSSWKRKLLEEFPHSLLIFGLVWVDL